VMVTTQQFINPADVVRYHCSTSYHSVVILIYYSHALHSQQIYQCIRAQQECVI
jgi:hypothetical protein